MMPARRRWAVARRRHQLSPTGCRDVLVLWREVDEVVGAQAVVHIRSFHLLLLRRDGAALGPSVDQETRAVDAAVARGLQSNNR
jgi:hypothetical protein